MPEQEQFPPQGWTPNESFAEAMLVVARKELKWYEWRKKFAVLRVLNQAEYRFTLEAQVTDLLLKAGAIPPTGEQLTDYGGGLAIWDGEWLREFLDILIEYAPKIIEIVIMIISLFAATEE